MQLDSQLCLGAPIRFQFRPVEGGAVIERVLRAGQAGVFSFFDVSEGVYDVAIKGRQWLQVVVPNISTIAGTNVLNLRVVLPGGDIFEDNVIDLFDLIELFNAYGSQQGDPGYYGPADLNCDRFVDLFDLMILFSNYGLVGDP